MLVATALAAMALAILAAAARADVTCYITLRYSGKTDVSYLYDQANPSFWQASRTFRWDESESVTVTYDARGNATRVPEVTGHSLEVSGSVTSTYAPPNSANDCMGTFSAVRNTNALPTAISFETGPSGRPEVRVLANKPDSKDFLTSTGLRECSSTGVIGGPTAKPDPTVQVEKVLDLEIARSIRDPITFDSSSSPGSRDLTTVSSDAALSVTFAGSPPAGGEPGRTNPLTPARTRAKINALSALRETADAALYPCLVAGTGTALFAGGLPGVAAGIVIEGVASPLCRAYIDTIRREAATVKDPPLSSIDTVARPVPIRSSVKLPSCRTLAAGARQLCNRLEPAARNLLATAARVESIAGAIATTVARDTAAANRRDTHAIAIQERALRSLLADAARARRAHARAGVALARALRAAGLSVVLTPTNTATAAKLVLARLAALGVSRATIQSLAGPELAPRSIDALATLGR